MSIGLLTLTAALAFGAPATQAPKGAPHASQKGSSVPKPAGGEVKWASSWDDAVATARKKPDGRILVEFTEEKCGECLRLESLVVPSTSFFTFTRDKVPVQVDRATPEGKKLAERLGVTDVPAWVVTTPDSVVCGIQVGTTNQGGWFETFVHTEQSWADYRKKLAEEAAKPGDEDLVFEIAQETFKRRGDAQAEPRFRRLATNAQKSALREQSLAYLASIELDAGRVEEAAKDLDTLLETAKDPALKERAELRRAEVDIARGRRDMAATRLSAFKKIHPNSPLVPDADALLAALRTKGVLGQN